MEGRGTRDKARGRRRTLNFHLIVAEGVHDAGAGLNARLCAGAYMRHGDVAVGPCNVVVDDAIMGDGRCLEAGWFVVCCVLRTTHTVGAVLTVDQPRCSAGSVAEVPKLWYS